MEIVLSSAAKTAIRILEDNGYEAYAVGGCVRDCVMGKIPNDYDITTSALPEQTKKCFSAFKTIETGLKHGTVSVIIDSEILEITTYRIDKNYTDHRHPGEVVFTPNLKDDLMRRDFTVNAMAYNDRAGLVDLFGGAEDIKNGIIRCVGDADLRFGEDALRIMRALRFAAVLGFDIEEKTKISIHNNKNLLEFIAKERIREEFNKLICAENPTPILLEFADVFSFVLGDWFLGLDGEKAEHITQLDRDVKIRLAFLFDTLTPDEAGDVLNSLKYDNITKKAVKTMLEYKNKILDTDIISMKKLLCKIGGANFVMLAKLLSDDNMIKAYREIKDKNMCYTVSALKISGSDIMALGIKGTDIGDMLESVLDAVIEEKLLNEKNEIIKFIMEGNL